VTDSKKPVEAASAAPGEKRSVPRPLAKASGAGDPSVHWLLGERNTAEMNGDADRAAWATAQLAELGFE
jgi:hypothetical protein